MISSKKENPTFGALAQRSYVINLFLAIEYDFKHGRNEKEEVAEEGTQEGQCASFSCWPVNNKEEHTLGRLSGWFLIFITTILKGKRKRKTWLLQDSFNFLKFFSNNSA
jgi:hypothetical protein